jgi:hypothetical protein
MERAKEGSAKEPAARPVELSQEALNTITGGATIPVKRIGPKSPQPRVYTA